MLAASCDRRGIAVEGEVASRGSAFQSSAGAASWAPSSGGWPVIRGPLPQHQQLTSMTGPCGWHTAQCRATVTRSPSRCSQTMARSSRCCTAPCLVVGSRPQVGQARGARAAAGRVRALAAGSLMRAWIGCGSVASGSAGAAVLWQTVYTQAALEHLAANGYPLDPADVARLTPLGHPTISLDGRYRTTSRPPTTGLRPLRTDLLSIQYRSSSQAMMSSRMNSARSPSARGPFLPYSGRPVLPAPQFLAQHGHEDEAGGVVFRGDFARSGAAGAAGISA